MHLPLPSVFYSSALIDSRKLALEHECRKLCRCTACSLCLWSLWFSAPWLTFLPFAGAREGMFARIPAVFLFKIVTKWNKMEWSRSGPGRACLSWRSGCRQGLVIVLQFWAPAEKNLAWLQPPMKRLHLATRGLCEGAKAWHGCYSYCLIVVACHSAW